MINTVTPSGFDTSSYGNVVELASASGVSLTFVEKGLHVTSIKFKDGQGKEHDIIIGSDEPAHYVDEKAYRHCLIGRYANRLPAETPLELPSGDSITLPTHPAKGQNLHGGPSPYGWDEKVLEKVELDKATLFSGKEIQFLKDQAAGIWSLTSPDGEGGHTGTVYCEIALAALDSTASGELGQVIIVYRAKLLDKPSTALNLTHHWGFNLGASHVANGQPKPARDLSIEEHVLTVNSKEILEHSPETGLVTGTTLSLSKDSAKAKDFRKGKTIGKVGEGYPTATDGLGQGYLGDGYDDFWVFDREPSSSAIKESELSELDVFGQMKAEEQATLASPESGVTIGFTTNQAGMQAWSGTTGVFDGSDARKAIHGGKSVRGQGDGYSNEVSGSALAMEFHAVYDAWLHPELEKKSWNTVLNKGEIYNNWVRMSIRSN